MTEQTFQQRAGAFSKKVLLYLTLIVLVAAAGTFSFYYWGVYERGSMAGKIMRISQKGVVFKTYEGKINLESFGALKGTSPIQEVFDFSIERKETDVIERLRRAALSGERVSLHFVKRYAAFPWRGETKYFVYKVEKIE